MDGSSDDRGIWLFAGLCLGALVVVALMTSEFAIPIIEPCDEDCLNEADVAAQLSMARSTWAMTVVAVGSLFVSIAAVFFVSATLRKTAEAVDAANRTADEAKRIGEAQVRAYVYLFRFRWTWHHSIEDNSLFYRIRPVWSNSGSTPTKHLQIFAGHLGLTAPLPGDFSFEVPPGVRHTPLALARDGTIEGDHNDITGADLKRIRSGELNYYVWGIATYRDVFPDTPERVTRFCYYLDPIGITGDPELEPNENDNVVGLTFRLHDRNNCADDECQS